MEKMVKRIKVFIVILLVILVSLIAFWGIFKQEKGVWKNLVPDYQYGMDVEGARELRYALDTTEEEKYVYVDENGNIMGEVWKDGSATTAEAEASSAEEGQASEEIAEGQATEENEVPYAKETRTIKVNPDDKLTKENFEASKKIIQERLKNQGLSEYNIRIDDVTGKLSIETANDNEDVALIENLISSVGKFEIIDYQNGLVLMDNSDIKNVSVVSSNESSYNTYLQIEFNKEGAEKLREISTKYVETQVETEETENTEETATEETTEETTEESTEAETEKKYVSIVFDDTTMMTTYFGEEMTAGMLQISVGEATTEYDEFVEHYNSAKTIADTLNSGVLPVTYELASDNFVKSEITSENIKTMKIVGSVIIAIISLIFIVKFKKNGMIAAILSIGYIAVLSLVTRYTNVSMTQNSIIAYAIIIFMDYIFMYMYLKKLQFKENGQAYAEVMKKFYLSSIAVSVIAIVFTLSGYFSINSIGMVLFWGIILNLLYNFIFTRTVLKK